MLRKCLFLKHGGHPHRDEQIEVYTVQQVSLGLGLTIALGRASS
jgi:hypothetical protein